MGNSLRGCRQDRAVMKLHTPLVVLFACASIALFAGVARPSLLSVTWVRSLIDDYSGNTNQRDLEENVIHGHDIIIDSDEDERSLYPPSLALHGSPLLIERMLEDEEEEPEDWAALRTTLIIYGIIFGVFAPVFCCVRLQFPVVYNVRNNVARLHCELCENAYGLVNWTWKIMAVPDDEIFDQCGMDAVCLLRIFRMGFRISLVGCFCSLFLLPLYVTSESDLKNEANETVIVDSWIKTTSSNLPAGSNRYIATAAAAYLIFGSSMYFLWKEFQWFTSMRARFLSKREPRNYTVYVSGIPSQRRSDAALAAYFRRIFSDDAVLEAYMVLNIPKLDAKVKERHQMQLKLEHAEALRDVKGIAVPMHTVVSTSKVSSAKKVVKRVPAIEFYRNKIEKLDDKIHTLKAMIEKRRKVSDMSFLGRLGLINIIQSPSVTSTPSKEPQVEVSFSSSQPDQEESVEVIKEEEDDEVYASAGEQEDEDEDLSVFETENRDLSPVKSSTVELDEEGNTSTSASPPRRSAGFSTTSVSDVRCHLRPKPTKFVRHRKSDYEGKPLGAGFVTFTKLSTVSAACQMVHTADPSGMRVVEPPQPDALLWANVGMSPSVRQSRQLISLAVTSTVCIFWTIPVTFLVSLTKPETYKVNFPRIGDMLERNPWLEGLLNQLGPLLIQLMNNVVLPEVMKLISKVEGVIGQSRLMASMTTKMAAFQIIQTFFIASIAGSLIEAFENFNDVGDIFNFLALTLPPQSEFFIALVLIDAVLVLGLELLRTTALIKAGLRKCIGPRLTEKERNMPYMSCRPLNNPRDFLFAHVYSAESLHYMVLFVYTVLAPLVSYVMVFAFLILEIGNRHQFFYIYPPTPDSGGRIWMEFNTVCLICLPIAVSILFVATGLREARGAFYMFIPLLAITILFVIYILLRYYSIFIHLPSEDCAEADAMYSAECDDFDFVMHKYRQPALLDGDDDDEDEDNDSEDRNANDSV